MAEKSSTCDGLAESAYFILKVREHSGLLTPRTVNAGFRSPKPDALNPSCPTVRFPWGKEPKDPESDAHRVCLRLRV